MLELLLLPIQERERAAPRAAAGMDTDFSENAPKQLAERDGGAYSPFKQPGRAVRPPTS